MSDAIPPESAVAEHLTGRQEPTFSRREFLGASVAAGSAVVLVGGEPAHPRTKGEAVRGTEGDRRCRQPGSPGP